MSKDELRGKLAEMYKAGKDQVSVFGFRTHYGGGKSTGFALLYDSVEALKKFEPHYRLVRIGQATKIEKASRQQRTFLYSMRCMHMAVEGRTDQMRRETTEESVKDVTGNGKGKGRKEGKEGQVKSNA